MKEKERYEKLNDAAYSALKYRACTANNFVNNGAAGNGSNGSASPDDNLLGNATGKEDGKANGTENEKRKLPTMLQQTGVTVSIFAVIGVAIGAVAAIVAAIRKRK